MSEMIRIGRADEPCPITGRPHEFVWTGTQTHQCRQCYGVTHFKDVPFIVGAEVVDVFVDLFWVRRIAELAEIKR